MTVKDFFSKPESNPIKTLVGVGAFLVASFFILTVAFPRSNLIQGLVNPLNKVDGTFMLTTTSAHTISSNIYGVSAAKFFDELPWSTDSSVQSAVTTLNPEVLRFPSGGTTKWYHFKTTYMTSPLTAEEATHLVAGNELRGYGNIEYDRIQEDDLEDLTGPGPGGVSYQDQQNEATQNYIRDFAQMAVATHAQVLFVANIHYASPNEVKEQVQFLKDQGVNIVGVELGNEEYSKGNFWLAGDPLIEGPIAVTNYLNAIAPYKTAIQAVLPTVPFAVTAAPKKTFGETEGVEGGFDADGDFNEQWNLALASQMGGKGYTKYVVHYYANFLNCAANLPATVANQASWGSCGLSELANIFSEDADTSLPKVLKWYADTYGSTKKMWFTEWNINQDPSRTDGAFGNTLFHAIFTTNVFNTLAQVNVDKNDLVEYATYHTLSTDGLKNTMISRKRAGETLNDNPGSPSLSNRRASYFGMYSMRDLLRSNPSKISVTATYSSDPGVVYVNAYKVGSSYYLHIANTADKTITLRNVAIDGVPIDRNTKLGSEYFIEGSGLFDARGANKFSNNPPQLDEYIRTSALKKIVVPAFSTGYIKIQ